MGKKIEHFQRNTFQQHLTYIIKTWGGYCATNLILHMLRELFDLCATSKEKKASTCKLLTIPYYNH